MSSWQINSSGNDFALSKRQVIMVTWTDDDLVNLVIWCIYASPRLFYAELVLEPMLNCQFIDA